MTDNIKMAHCMERAQVCLRTGQLRLAELYMRRALQETAGGRWWLECEAIRETVRRVGAAFAPILGLLADPPAAELRRSDFALAAE